MSNPATSKPETSNPAIHEAGHGPSCHHGEKAGETPLQSLPVRLALLPVQAYRRLISPLIAPRCRYHPTCSTYALEAIRTYGPVRGALLAAWRVLRCNPFSDGGFDPVSEQRLFKIRAADEQEPETTAYDAGRADGEHHRSVAA